MQARTTFGKFTLAVMISCALMSCTRRGEYVEVPDAAKVGKLETVIVSTPRTKVDGPAFFSSDRSYQTNYALFQVSVPPEHVPGSVEYPRAKSPNVQKDFVVASSKSLPDERAFIGAINAVSAERKTREGFLFIHGYNHNFSESLYGQAQLDHDLARTGVPVQFAWPSAGRVMGYAHDLDSALFSRDDLKATINAMSRSNLRGFNLVAHSMGTFLLMDTLRGMATSGDTKAFGKLNAIVLISPDIDVDVFRRQAAPVLARGIPIYVIVSSGDRALRMSALIRGDENRLGSIRDASALGGLDVAVLDLSQLDSNGTSGHFKVGTNPELIAFIQALAASGLVLFNSGPQPGFFASSAAVVQSGTGVLLSPLAN